MPDGRNPLDDFVDVLRGMNRSVHTIRAYRCDLQGLAAFLSPRSMADATLADLEAHLTALAGTTTGTTRARKAHVFRAFFGWHERRTGTPSVATNLAIPKKERRAIRPLTEAEYRTVRDAVRDDLRLAAIIEVFLQTGIRVGELVALHKNDVVRSSIAADGCRTPARLRIRQGKGRQDREVALNSVAEKAIRRYLKVRPRRAGHDELFMSRCCQPLSPRSVHFMLVQVYKKLGIRGAAVHSLRHTHATEHVHKGTDLIALGYQLGHASVATTQQYVHLVRARLEAQMEENRL